MPPRPWSSAERSQGGCMWHDALEDPLSKSMPHCLWVRMLERAVWANSPACLVESGRHGDRLSVLHARQQPLGPRRQGPRLDARARARGAPPLSRSFDNTTKS